MEIIILTGMSGSGKSKVSDYLEDMGFFCIDNLPPQLLGSILHSFTEGKDGEGFGVDKLAFVIDIRSAGFFDGISSALADLNNKGLAYRLIFLDSTDETLLSRYKQTRRVHPLAVKGGIGEAIRREREQLEPLRREATDIIDTTNFSLGDLRDYIYRLLEPDGDIDRRMSIIVESFGFKYGIPVDCDIVQDVRFIPNPYYDVRLRVLTGLDKDVVEAVFRHDITCEYVQSLSDMLEKLIPYYVHEGKVRLTIGVGCTGGRHRSVAIAEEIAVRIKGFGYSVRVIHRDIENDPRNITKLDAYWGKKETDVLDGNSIKSKSVLP